MASEEAMCRQSGWEQAFVALFKGVEAELHGFVRHRIGSCGDAHDIVLQQTRRRFEIESRRELRRIINRSSETDLRRVVEIQETRVREDPESLEAKHLLASSYHRLGDVLVNTDRLTDDIWAYEKAITLLRQLLRDKPGDVASRVELAEIFCKLGETFWALDQGPGARMAYAQALIVTERLTLDYPELSTYRDDLARTRIRLNQLSSVAGSR